MTKNEQRKYITIAAALAGAYILYRGHQAAERVKEVVTEDLNPASTENVVYSGVNAIGASVTGNEGFSLGGWIYDKLNPGEAKP